jgi:hypothetical protein
MTTTGLGGGHVGHPPSPESSRTLRRLHADADHRLALFGPLLISVWLQETRIAALRAMERVIETSARDAPGGRLGMFVVVEPHATAPSSAVRDELPRIRRTSSIALTALVHEGNGFGAALVRGITTGLNLLEGSKTHTHVFADVTSAARWIETTAPQYGGGSALAAAVLDLRTSVA